MSSGRAVLERNPSRQSVTSVCGVPQVDPLGDVDIELLTARRPGYDPFAYGKASGRNFNTFMDHVLWADTDVARHLAKRSAAINITPEDVDNIGAEIRVIYAMADDPSARPMNLQ